MIGNPMKMKSLLAAIVLLSGFVFAQTDTIPLVTARDINFIQDSVAATWPPSPMAGKTVHVRGSVMYRTMVDPVTDRRPILTYTKAWSTYIQATDNSPWSGLNIYQTDSTIQGTLFDLVDTASTYEFTGVVTTFGQGTELVLTTTPQPIPAALIDQQMARPAPLRLTMDSLYTPQGTFNYALRKYYGMYVAFYADETHPLITSDLITGTASTAGGFKVNDLSGHKFQMYAQSNYFKTASTYPRLRTGYTPPPNGSYIPYIKGILMGYNSATDGWIWEVVPVYPGDLGIPLLSPPSITNVKRDVGVVAPNTAVKVTATVVPLAGGGKVTSVWLMKHVNGGTLDSTQMLPNVAPDTTTYSATIQGIATDSSFVDYYVKAFDSNNLSSTNPQNTANSRFSFFVLKRDLRIQDVRYSPFGSGYSSYNGYKVKITGVVVSDTSDIPGNHGSNPSRVYIQNGNTPWSGILLGTGGPLAANVGKLKRGDNVTVEGIVALGGLGNRIDTLDLITVNSSNNALPAPVVLKTSDVGTYTMGNLSAEPWDGMLVTYNNVTIDSANADGTSNFGESFGKDANGGTHTRLIWSDGNTFLNAGAAAVKVNKGDKFTSITGVLGYTHANYKLCARKDADILGYVSDVKTDARAIPATFKLEQNYPNPFNPSTTIAYALPKAGFVKVTIFNVLGQEVKTLVNQVQSAGSHEVSFDASSLNSGVYLYSLQVENYKQVKKMMLLK
jgi:hypothetical protein